MSFRRLRVQTKSALWQTERNAAGFDAFFLVGVVAYGRGKNASKSNDGGHFARHIYLHFKTRILFAFCVSDNETAYHCWSGKFVFGLCPSGNPDGLFYAILSIS